MTYLHDWGTESIEVWADILNGSLAKKIGGYFKLCVDEVKTEKDLNSEQGVLMRFDCDLGRKQTCPGFFETGHVKIELLF